MKNVLLCTVAACALMIVTVGGAQAAPNNYPNNYPNNNYNANDPNVLADDSALNLVQATQGLTSTINGSGVSEGYTSGGDTDSTYQTGDINYDGTTFNAVGAYTLQNQTGLNNAGNNGANIAAQVNNDASGVNIDLSGGGAAGTGATNAVNASQTMNASIINSPVTVSNYLNDETRTLNRTGDVGYDTNTFGASGLFTLQNQTGLNNAGNNGANMSVQANLDANEAINMDGGSTNQVAATQSLTSIIDPSNVTITNNSNVDELNAAPSRTGDVTYSQNTFDAPGLFTLQNNTGMNNAANNGANLAVQVNTGASDSIDIEDNAHNVVLASQTMGSTIAASTVAITTNADSPYASRTGDVTYASNTFDAPGVFTISNNTGLNNAANNALNVSVQMNGL